MELIGVGFIAAGLSIWAAMPTYRRRGRRKELGLPPKPDEDWRNEVPPGYRSGGWSETRFYGARRRP